MTSEAKIESNRLNARRSTGPRTAAGKALAKYNAVRHGVLTAAPLVPGEDVAAWDQHFQGVLVSLQPSGTLETALAERVATVLWRLNRVARFEALATAAAVADAVLPQPHGRVEAMYPLAEPIDAAIDAAKTTVGVARLKAEAARDVADHLETLSGRPAGEVISGDLADQVLSWASEVLEQFDLDGDPPGVDDRRFLSRVGVKTERDWTVAKLLDALKLLAAYAGEDACWLAAETAKERRAAAERHARERRLAREKLAGLRERKRTAPARRAVSVLLPAPERGDLVVRYEGHLQKLLTTTLRELERLQAFRADRTRPAPQVLEASVAGPPAGG